MKDFDVIVVGGGSSGMMAAGRAAALGKRVLLLEKNRELGAKLSITGGGRCNITNATYNAHDMLANYGKASQFLFSPFSQFGVKDTFEFFEKRGLRVVVQALNRAFPITEKAPDVVAVFEKYLEEGRVTIMTGSAVTKVLHDKKGIIGVVAGKENYTAKNYIFSTGGASHPETGSTGDGFEWLRQLGHNVKSPRPTIVPLKTSDKWSHKLSGVSIGDSKITFFQDNKKQFSKTGEILFTHFGVSGPLILNSAWKVGDLIESGSVNAKIDVYPKLQINELDAKILGIFEKNKNKILKNVLKEILPDGTTPGISLLLEGIDLNAKVNYVTKEQRRKIIDVLKNLPVTITGLMGFERAVVADGGVTLEEVDTKTMRSRVVPNLFIIGDLLHIDRPSGGYSLQLCWTTGYVAGNNA